jgi:CRP-like cAMP-binding protein
MPTDEAGTTVELLVALKAVAPFSSLPPEDLALLVERSTLRTWAPGAVLVQRRAAVEAIHVVLDGSLVEERAGRAFALREPYEIVGGVDALAGSSADLEVRAKVATRTLELGRETLLEVCYDRFDVLNTIATGVAAMGIAARLHLGSSAAFRNDAASAADHVPHELTLPERAAFMRGIPALRETPILTLAEVAAESEQVAFQAGERLWRTGDRADHLLLIVSGVLDCAAGDDVRFALGAHEAAGVLDALAAVPRWYDATARTPVVALRSRLSDVMDALEDDPAAAVAGLTQLARATSALVAAIPAATTNGRHRP